MEEYKLSCPRCGQHIAYTKDYCGRHMECPSCSGNVTFPALPPTGKTPLRLERDRPKVKQRFHFDVAKILGATVNFFRTFEHWQIVAMCAVPFLLIGLGLGAASLLRKHDVEDKPNNSAVTASQSEQDQRMAALTQATAIVEDRVKSVWAAKNALDAANRKRTAFHAQYDGKQMSQQMRNALDAQYKAIGDEIAVAESNLNGWRKAFDTAYANYQQAGGKVNYQSQLPR